MSNLPTAIRRHLSALRILILMTVVCGVIYPLAVTGVAQAAFGHRANGSLVKQDGHVVGSSLLGQNFDLPKKNPDNADEAPRPDPKFFQPRPSAGGYDPLASGATNLGPNDPDLVKAIQQRRHDIAAFDGVDPAKVPADALTSSGSGLDPDISPAYAYEQVNRVAKARGLSADEVHKLVADNVDGRSLGFLGEAHVNVLELNKDLAKLS
ncbi:K+-transporting ATPase ATPase C chain [Streptomyces sp. DvalAA-14]|uniref:potassium-transporting ATPase subunit KdpC n=1 Tax=unclassified Streptomyces TaxID=2593676 RepID=UPI00081AFDC2|nr:MULTISPECIES: potassium-transporting ATPase subunit KdpC [unclassified Streptomyces]MYS24837.1 potassium-transporting ATPase subunit KdpC [Streptomyces sp. SID4948]SCE49828.1 K+-transporting ATPase ATPase C chain [Streptomyces sp. DvalAA-14]